MLQRLSLVLLFAIAAVVAAALALGAYLNYGSVKAAYLTQVQSRLQAIGAGIVDDIEISLSFGIPLAGQDALGARLHRELAVDPAIQDIDILSTQGTILHSSDTARVGETLPMIDASIVHLDVPIENDFGGEAGSVRIVADMAVLDANLESTAEAVRNAAIYALLGSLAMAVVSLILLLSGAQRRAEEASHLTAGEGDPESSWAFHEVDRAQDELETRLKGLETQRG